MRTVLSKTLFLFLFGCCLWTMQANKVSLDTGDKNCIGCIGPNSLLGNTNLSSNVVRNLDTISCLKRCVLRRTEIAVYGEGHGCFCIRKSVIDSNTKINDTCCRSTIPSSRDSVKVYNLTGIIITLKFDEYVEQNKSVNVDYNILLCDHGEVASDVGAITENITFVQKCTVKVLPRNNKSSKANLSCWSNLVFSDVGENEVCIASGGSYKNTCTTVKVLAPLELYPPMVSPTQYSLETRINVKVRGTAFKLSYSFGDGSHKQRNLIEPYVYKVCETRLSIGHNYSNPGEYIFNISASNPIKTLVVSKKIIYEFNAKMETELLYWEHNRIVVLIKVIHHPVNDILMYKWSSSFPSIRIMKNVTTEPWTKVSSINTLVSMTVSVFSANGDKMTEKRIRIKIGTLSKVLCDDDSVLTGRNVTCRVTANPPLTVTNFEWKVNGMNVSQSGKVFHNIFRKPGRYNISVSHPKVKKATVVVIDGLKKLEVFTSESLTAAAEITFKVIVEPTKDVSFSWSFGDGVEMNVHHTTVVHTYHSTGRFQVTVTAQNKVSNLKKSINITVHSFCYKVQSSFDDDIQMEIYRSRPIHLEMGIRYSSCARDLNVRFIWKMFQEQWLGWREMRLTDKDMNKTTFGIFIPPNSLEYRRYKFNVSVAMTLRGKTTFPKEYALVVKIIRSPIKAIIRGGFVRYVSQRSEDIVIDATLSYDPDYPNESDIKFSWNCQRKLANEKCFKHGNPLINAGAFINIPSSEFDKTGSPYVFQLVIKHRGHTSLPAFQAIYVKKEIKENVILDCEYCNEGVVDPSKTVTFVKNCKNCDHSKKSSWLVTQFGDASHITTVYFEEQKCIEPNRQLSGRGEIANDTSTPSVVNILCKFASHSANYFDEVNSLICSKSAFYKRICNEYGMPREFSRNNVMNLKTSPFFTIRKNVLPTNTFLLIESVSDENTRLASRYVFVEEMPPTHSCTVTPKTGIGLHENFQLKCFSSSYKKELLFYKVVFENEDNGDRMNDIFLYTTLRSFTFQLPGELNKTAKYLLKLAIENSKGVEQEYCPMVINVLPLNHSFSYTTIEEYLFNRSVLVKNQFHGHKYAYHGHLLHNITIIADVLNRLPNVSSSSTKFHLRVGTRQNLIRILSATRVSGKYITRQFLNALESSTREPRQLDKESSKIVAKTLSDVWLLDRLKSAFPDNFVTLVSRTLKMSTHQKIAMYDDKLLVALKFSLQDVLQRMRLGDPFKLFETPSFSSVLLKINPDRDQNVSVNCRDTLVSFSRRAEILVNQPYTQDVYGFGVMALCVDKDVTIEKDNDNIIQISPLVNIDTYNSEGQSDNHRLENLNVTFPTYKFQADFLTDRNYSITSIETHRFQFNKSGNSAFDIEIRSLARIARKFKIRFTFRCLDQFKQIRFSSNVILESDVIKQVFSREQLKSCYKFVDVDVGLEWNIKATEYEKMNSIAHYAISAKWISCFSRRNNADLWSSMNCHLDVNPLFSCSCPKAQKDMFVATKKSSPFVFERNPTTSETPLLKLLVFVVLAAFYCFTVIVLVCMEKCDIVRLRQRFVLTPSDPAYHKYQVTVFTGHVFGAGTTAKVALVLHGEQNSSHPFQLSVDDHSLFNRNSRDIFYISVRHELGALTSVHLWHDNAGNSPAWFVDKLIVTNLDTRERWGFSCCKWLAVDKNDKKLDCKVSPDAVKQKVTYKTFCYELGKKLMDKHLWLSVIGMPTYSLFKRSERFTCCVLLIFGYLYANSTFPHSSTVDCYSLFNPSWTNMKLGFFSTLLITPLCFVITSLFICTKRTGGKHILPFADSSKAATIEKKDGFPALDKCASVIQELHFRSRRYMQGNKVHPLENDNIGDEGLYSVADSSITERDEIFEVNHDNSESHSYSEASRRDFSSVDTQSLLRSSDSKKWLPIRLVHFIWLTCISFFLLSGYLTFENTKRFRSFDMVCYFQRVLWAIFFSVFLLQPFKAVIFTCVTLLYKEFSYIDEVDVDESSSQCEPVLIPDTNIQTSEKKADEIVYQKLLYLKYLKPLTKRELSKARHALEKNNETLSFIRDILLYTFVLVVIALMISSVKQDYNIYSHEQHLKSYFGKGKSVKSSAAWLSSGPQKMIAAFTYDRRRRTINVWNGTGVVMGKPKIVIATASCKFVDSRRETPGQKCSSERPDVLNLGETFEETLAILRNVSEQLPWDATTISFEVVVYFPALDSFSEFMLSFENLGSGIKHDVSVSTFKFQVDGATENYLPVLCQVLFTVVFVLVIMRQLVYSQKMISLDIHVLIVILTSLSYVLMWIWIKRQYRALSLVNKYSFDADLIGCVKPIRHAQDNFMDVSALMLFFLSFKMFQLVGLNKLFSFYIETFLKTLKMAVFPLFCLLLMVISFSHVGNILLGGTVAFFSTFVESLYYNIVYLKKSGHGNLLFDNNRDQTKMSLYVVTYLIFMGFTAFLVKAVFIFSYKALQRTARRKSFHIKTIFSSSKKRLKSLLKQFGEKPAGKQQQYIVPLHCVLKEVNEQLDEIHFRLVNLFANENMPPKQTRYSTGSSSENTSGIELVHTKNEFRDAARKVSSEFSESPTDISLNSTISDGTSSERKESSESNEHAIERGCDRINTVIVSTRTDSGPTDVFRNATRGFPKPLDIESDSFARLFVDVV